MTDLESFVKRLIEVLEARDPIGVHRPFSVADLRNTILPYRLNRAALGLSNADDYELLVLRLVAEEGGFARTNPPEAAEIARNLANHPNPDLDLVETLGETTVQIGAAGLARIVEVSQVAPPAPAPRKPAPAPWAPRTPEAVETPDPEPSSAAAAPRPEPEPTPELFEPIADNVVVDEPAPPAAPSRSSSARPPVTACPACHRSLPTHRDVVFCPFCGAQVGVQRCSRCGSDIEPGWRHCVTCGHQVAPGTVA